MTQASSNCPGLPPWRGFTLVEIAIALVVLGLVVTTAVPFFVQRIRREKVQATQREMQEIKQVILGYYRDHLTLPTSGAGWSLPDSALLLPPSATEDEIYTGSAYAYVAINEGDPYLELNVDGRSLGASAAVLISKGRNLKFDQENADVTDGHFTQRSDDAAFDDIVVTIAQGELEAATAWRHEIQEDIGVLNAAANLLAANDDDHDGFLDEDAGDPAGDWDVSTDWSMMDANGLAALTRAGAVSRAEHLVDPWGNTYLWDVSTHEFYSAGANGLDEGRTGDDIVM